MLARGGPPAASAAAAAAMRLHLKIGVRSVQALAHSRARLLDAWIIGPSVIHPPLNDATPWRVKPPLAEVVLADVVSEGSTPKATPPRTQQSWAGQLGGGHVRYAKAQARKS